MTWQVWHVSPIITSVFFILGVFTLYQVLFNWLKTVLDERKIKFDEDVINSWFGVIYMLIFIFSLQSTIVGKSSSWEFMNFIVIALIFCAYFLNIRIPYYWFIPIILVYMVFNGSIGYWESWCHAASVMFTYWSFNYIKRLHTDKYLFLRYMLVGISWGAIMWFFVAIKFSLSRSVFIQEWIYLIIFEILLYSYVRMLLRESSLKVHLFEFANHDALTKAQNYGAYNSEIKYLFSNSQKNNLNLSMTMFDIDHFKKINDTYGHLAGDEVLKQVVSTAQSVIDANDSQVLLYRTGGEEFNILFPGYDLQSTKPLVQKIFSALNNMTVDFEDKKIKVTVSMGVSAVSKRDDEPADFYDRVDINLYYSKKHGRMRITAQ